MRAIILGGGVAGLAAAISLDRAGYETVVCEQAPAYGNAGLAFLILPNGMASLEQLGLAEQVRKRGMPIKGLHMRLDDGTPLKEAELDDAVCITRVDFIDILAAGAPTNCIKYAKRFKHFDYAVDGTIRAAYFEDGSSEVGDLFIGSDGIRSQVRETLFSNGLLTDVRIMELVCLVEAPDIVEQLGPYLLKTYDPTGGLAFGMAPCDSQRIVTYLQYDPQRYPLTDTSCTGKRAFAERLVGSWPEPIPMILARTDFDYGYIWHTSDLEPLPIWYRQNAVLLGDAAHAFLTFTSQGVNSALQDALVLAECLTNATPFTYQHCFAAYDQRRRETVLEYLEQGRLLAEHFLHPESVGDLDIPLAK